VRENTIPKVATGKQACEDWEERGRKGPYGLGIRDGVRQVAAAARAGGARPHASGQGCPCVDASRHGAAGVEVLVDGHGQRLSVQELLLRRRQLWPAARRPRAPHPLAARHRGRGPLLLARHARERVAHWEEEEKKPRELVEWEKERWSGGEGQTNRRRRATADLK
jgi:hypothetical protein